MDYFECKKSIANREKFNPTKGRCTKSYRLIDIESRTCEDIDFDNMTKTSPTR